MGRGAQREGVLAAPAAREGEGGGAGVLAPGSGAAAEYAACTEVWAVQALEELRLEAEAVAARFLSQWLVERQRRPKSQWGRVGVRVRRLTSGRAPPGAFAIEWFRFQWARPGAGQGPRVFTTYLAKGRGDRYPPAAFRRAAQPWELALIEACEEDFARLRALARSIGRVRLQAKLHVQLERRLRLTSPRESAGGGARDSSRA